MKRTLLLVSLLFSVPALADHKYESMKSGLDSAQADADAAERRVADLNAQLDASKSQLSSASGKPEYAEEIARLNEANRKLAEECNQAVAACKAENRKLQDAVSRCAGVEHKVVSEGGRYTLQKHETSSSATPAKPAQTTRAPYASRGNVYPRAVGQ